MFAGHMDITSTNTLIALSLGWLEKQQRFYVSSIKKIQLGKFSEVNFDNALTFKNAK